MISINYGSSATSRKLWRWVSLDLIFTMRDIYTSIQIWTHSQNSLAAAETLGLKICSHGTSQIITNTVSMSKGIVISYATKCCFEIDQKSIKIETIWSEFSNGRKAIAEQILRSEEIYKFKWLRLWQTQSGIWVGTLSSGIRSFEIIEEKL